MVMIRVTPKMEPVNFNTSSATRIETVPVSDPSPQGSPDNVVVTTLPERQGDQACDNFKKGSSLETQEEEEMSIKRCHAVSSLFQGTGSRSPPGNPATQGAPCALCAGATNSDVSNNLR